MFNFVLFLFHLQFAFASYADLSADNQLLSRLRVLGTVCFNFLKKWLSNHLGKGLNNNYILSRAS